MAELTSEQKQQLVRLIQEEQRIEDRLSAWRRALAGGLGEEFIESVQFIAQNGLDRSTAREVDASGAMTASEIADVLDRLIARYRAVRLERIPLCETIGQQAFPVNDDMDIRVPLHIVKRLREVA